MNTYFGTTNCTSAAASKDVITTSCESNNNMYLDPDDAINEVAVNSVVWSCVPKPATTTQYLYNYAAFSCPANTTDDDDYYYYYYYDDDSGASAAAKALATAAIAGIVVGSVAVLAIASGVVYFYFLKTAATATHAASATFAKSAGEKSVVEVASNPIYSSGGQQHLANL